MASISTLVPPRRRLVRPLVVASALGLVAVACGDGSSGSSAADSAAEELTGPPVTVPLLIDLSNTQGLYEGWRNSYRAAVDAVNADGGIDGRPLELEVCDTGLDPNLTAQCGREVVDGDAVAVFAIAQNGAQFVPLLEEAGIPIVGDNLQSPPDFSSPISFPIYGGGGVGTAGLGTALDHLECEDATLVTTFPPAVLSRVEQSIRSTADEFGIEVRTVTGTPGAPDQSPVVASALRDDPDCLAIVAGGADEVSLIKAARQSAADVEIVTPAGLLPSESLASLGADAEGLRLVSLARPASSADDHELVQAWVDGIEASDYSPQALDDQSANAWAAVMLFAHVAGGLETLDAAAVLEALNALADYDPGIVPPVSYSEPVPENLLGDRVFSPYVMFTHVEDGVIVADTGEFVDVFTGEPAAV